MDPIKCKHKRHMARAGRDGNARRAMGLVYYERKHCKDPRCRHDAAWQISRDIKPGRRDTDDASNV